MCLFDVYTSVRPTSETGEGGGVITIRFITSLRGRIVLNSDLVDLFIFSVLKIKDINMSIHINEYRMNTVLNSGFCCPSGEFGQSSGLFCLVSARQNDASL